MEFTLPRLAFLLPAAGAVVVYMFLRFVVWAPRTGSTASSVSQHAFWVGIIGWMASSLHGAMHAGQIPPGTDTAPNTPDQLLMVLGWPVAATLVVHAIGQWSYPAPRQPRRHAELSVRRIRDFLPRGLAWTTAVIFAGTTATLAWISGMPGFEAVQAATAPDGGYIRPAQPGRIPGAELAAWLGGALLFLAIGTLLVLWLIAHRRQLETLDADDNRALRTLAMNRLLRTVATVASGLAAVAGNFAMLTPPGVVPSSMFNPAAAANIIVLLVMWRWRHGELPSLAAIDKQREAALPHRIGHPAARLSVSIGAWLGVIAALPLFAGLFLIPALSEAGSWGMPGWVAVIAALILLAIAAGELLTGTNYGSAEAAVDWPRQPVSRGLLGTAITGAALLLLVLVLTAIGQARLYEAPAWPAVAGLTAVVLLAGAAALWTVRRRAIPASGEGTGLDGALRAIAVYRAARTLAAYFVVQAGVLLMMLSHAFTPLFEEPTSFVPQDQPAIMTAGAIIATLGVAIAVTPVRSLLRALPRPAGPRLESTAP
ncbi:hypothetical protein BIU82_10230 [Arthrobacter sp. SW1]|uniref:hypothetical protein n=1 Tax=Arthrobacter sp. SW1 TaxID=1920889 RepID=UPI000877B1A4|nr:hypothetical protein [Arthrobacter sp. SW1]OFI37546.1 hypothetical protein BIU82_10230 [Arthrobacter sp. SW1]